MFEYLGLIYGLAKDLIKYLKWHEEEKLIDSDWLEESGFKQEAEASGFELRWSRPEKLEFRRFQEWAELLAVNKKKKKRYKLVRKDGSILIGRKTGGIGGRP